MHVRVQHRIIDSMTTLRRGEKRIREEFER